MKDVVGGGISGAAAGLNMIVKVNGEAFAYDEFELPAEVKAVGRTFTNFVLGEHHHPPGGPRRSLQRRYRRPAV